jgi:hypothetical protein
LDPTTSYFSRKSSRILSKSSLETSGIDDACDMSETRDEEDMNDGAKETLSSSGNSSSSWISYSFSSYPSA